MVEDTGFEPVTSALRRQRSPTELVPLFLDLDDLQDISSQTITLIACTIRFVNGDLSVFIKYPKMADYTYSRFKSCQLSIRLKKS